MWKLMIIVVLCGGGWLYVTSVASGQNLSPFDATNPLSRGPFNTATYSRPTVSPYVNLGDDSNGTSNYQTQVRPRLLENALIERQSTALNQLERQMRGAGPHQNSRAPWDIGPGGPRQSGVRFMHYSHYFGTAQ